MSLVQYYVTDTKETTPDEITENARYEFESDNEYCIEDGDLSGFRFLVEECANQYHDDHDGWESDWPCFFMLWIDGEYLGMFETELQYDPTFTAEKVA